MLDIFEQKALEVGKRMEGTYKVSSLLHTDEKTGNVGFIDPLTLIALIGLLITVGKTVYDCWKEHRPSKPVTFEDYLVGRSHASMIDRFMLRKIVGDTLKQGFLSKHVSELTFAIIDVAHDSKEDELKQCSAEIVKAKQLSGDSGKHEVKK